MLGVLLSKKSIRAVAAACVGIAATVLLSLTIRAFPGRLEVYPNHTRLPVGDQIRYSVFQTQEEGLDPSRRLRPYV